MLPSAGQAMAVHFVVQINLKKPLMRMYTSDEVMNASLIWLQMLLWLHATRLSSYPRR